jgi:hypothetical protein
MFSYIKSCNAGKTFLKILFFFLLVTQICFAQTKHPNDSDNLLSFVMEDFEDDTFPPAGWSVEYTSPLFWNRYVGASSYGNESASAQFFNYMAPSGTSQSLVLSSFSASQLGDSLSFDHAYATFQSENDRLIIETSTNGGNTYSILVTLNGGVSGPLVTAPPTVNVFIPTYSQWATKKYGLPLGTNCIRFKAISAYGNNLYLDNISIGTQSSIDVTVLSIDIPNPTLTLPQIPKVTVKNLGAARTSFTVTMDIAPEGYTSTKTFTGGLPSNAIAEIYFDEWTPTSGEHNVTTYTTLPGDMDNSNDTLVISIQANQPQLIQNINATYQDGQVFVTWDNLPTLNTKYTLYKSSTPIQYGYQLGSAQNLGIVYDNTALNKRLSNIVGTSKYLKIDSSSFPLASTKGLFVATSTVNGQFYYAIIPIVNNVEDTTILIGSNSLSSPISEVIQAPKPIWQENRNISGKTFEIYVLFATKVTSNIFPQMTNAGTFPYNLAIVKSGNSLPHPVTFYFHPGGLHFLPTSTYFRTIGDPNEWVISIDEWIPGIEGQTNCYGFHENYDVFSNFNQVPTSGILHNYTAAKVEYIVNWALRNLPLDSTRTYMTGWSMGAMGAIFNSIMLREKIAATFVYAPSFNMALGITLLDRLWGTYQMNLQTNEGFSRNERLNTNFLLSNNKLNSLPLIFTFCGKNDESVGWNEKIAFYDSVNSSKHGGFHFWSASDHQQVFLNSPWQPNFPNFSFFTRYRTDLSYPAFSNCSINDSPGNGTPTNGDAIGSINGHLEWTDDIVDLADKWEITLYLNDLLTTLGADIAPDSATTDVTLRRLQNFVVPTDSGISWVNRRNDIVMQQGTFTYNGGLITIPSVKVFKDSSRLSITYPPVSVEEQITLPTKFVLSQNYPNPFNPNTKISWQSPVSSWQTLKVFDLLGNEVATLVNEEKPAGVYELNWNVPQLSSGVYFYRLQAEDFIQTRKMILLK